MRVAGVGRVTTLSPSFRVKRISREKMTFFLHLKLLPQFGS